MSARYYEPSGRVPPLAPLLGLVVALPVAAIAAFAYAYASLYIPIIGTISFILTAGYAVIVGVSLGLMLHRAKLRNRVVAALLGLVTGVFALWASWVVYCYALLHRSSLGDDVTLVRLAMRPDALFAWIQEFNEVGTWSFKGSTPTGAFLWFLWALEAAIIVGGVVLTSSVSIEGPYCETCDRWCEEHKDAFVRGEAPAAQLKAWVESGQLDALKGLPPAGPPSTTHFDIDECSQCRSTIALSIRAQTILRNEKATETTVVTHLLLSQPQLDQLKAALS